MRREDPGGRFAKGKRQAMEQLVRPVPDVFVWANVEFGLEVFFESFSDEAVHPVSANHEIAVAAQRIDSRNFRPELYEYAEFVTSSLQNLQQTQPRNSGEAVAMNRDLLAAMNDIDIVPGFEIARDLCVRRFVGSAQI